MKKSFLLLTQITMFFVAGISISCSSGNDWRTRQTLWGGRTDVNQKNCR